MNNTIFIILLNLFCYLEQDHFSQYLSQYKLFSPRLIIESGQYQNLFISHFYHINFGHFLINMSGFYNISNIINRQFHNKYWLIILSTAVLSNIIHILISLLGIQYYNNYDIFNSYSLGLSKIIFAIRALYYNRLNTYVSVFGRIVHSKYVIWIELFFIALLAPNSDFIGHLSGITAGLLINNFL